MIEIPPALILSGADAGLAFLCTWLLAAWGGWCAGAAAYYATRHGGRIWRRLGHLARAALCGVGTLVTLLGVMFLPATLPCAVSAWHYHQSRHLRVEKIYGSLRSLTRLRAAALAAPAHPLGATS